mgnify:CR=1 FL=1
MLPTPSDATLQLARAIELCDVDSARQALDAGANPNERVSKSLGWRSSVLELLAKQITSREEFEQWEPMARLLLSFPAGTSVKSQAEFVFSLIKKSGNEGLEWALNVGVSTQALFERVSRLGVQISLFDAAIQHGKGDLAVRLWDEFGVGPKAAGDRLPTHSSSLVASCNFNSRISIFEHSLWARLLDLSWPQQDLDAALRRSVGTGNAALVGQLLEKGANPNCSGHEDEPLPALVQYLGALGGKCCPGVVKALAKHGANLDERVDFSLGLMSGVQYLRLSTAPPAASLFDPDHHDVSLLALACLSRNRDDVLALLELGAAVNHPTREGNTPLHLLALSPWAAAMSSDASASPSILMDLLDAGADVVASTDSISADRPPAWR